MSLVLLPGALVWWMLLPCLKFPVSRAPPLLGEREGGEGAGIVGASALSGVVRFMGATASGWEWGARNHGHLQVWGERSQVPLLLLLLLGERAVGATYWAPQPWCPTPGRWVPLAGRRAGRNNRRAVRSLDSPCWLPKQGKRMDLNCTGRWPLSYDHPSACPSLKQALTLPRLLHDKAPHWGEGCHDWGESFVVRHQGVSDLDQPLCRVWAAITGTKGGSASEVVQISDCSQTATVCTPTYVKHPWQSLLLQHCSFLGRGCWCWEQGEHALERSGASLDLNLRVSAPGTWDLTPLPIGWWWPLSREDQAQPGSGPSPPSLATPTITLIAASTQWEKQNLCSHQIQLSHQSHWAHADCIGKLPDKDTPSKLQYTTRSPNFIETEKGNQK